MPKRLGERPENSASGWAIGCAESLAAVSKRSESSESRSRGHHLELPARGGFGERFLDLAERDFRTNRENRFPHAERIELVLLLVSRAKFLEDGLVRCLARSAFHNHNLFSIVCSQYAVRIF